MNIRKQIQKLYVQIIYFYIPDNKPDSNNYIKISIVELISIFFKGLNKLIKTQLNINNNDSLDIILTCPAYFHDLQRTQLKNGVESANFKVYKLLIDNYIIHKIFKSFENNGLK